MGEIVPHGLADEDMLIILRYVDRKCELIKDEEKEAIVARWFDAATPEARMSVAGELQELNNRYPNYNILWYPRGMWAYRRDSYDNYAVSPGCGAIQAVLSFIREMPEFKTCENMCDFAGSIGYYSFAFMQENPQLTSHVYDLPEVCALAREIKEKEAYYNRITFHDFDIASSESFGNGYDLFFSSHFLYKFSAEGTLAEFFKKVNQSMEPGGLFISNHITTEEQGKNNLTLSIVELMTRSVGYPTHQLPEDDLKSALSRAGFGVFRTKFLEKEMPYPTLLLSAVKTEGTC